jgi:twitching motility protein PilT
MSLLPANPPAASLPQAPAETTENTPTSPATTSSQQASAVSATTAPADPGLLLELLNNDSFGNGENDIEIETFLRMAIAQGVSDIHLRVGCPPVLRKDGAMVMTKLPPLDQTSIINFTKNIMPVEVRNKVKPKTDFDFGFKFENLSRFRVNVFYEMNQIGLVLRLIPIQIPTLEQIGLPPVLKKFAEMHKGLVLVTGPTGSGKSTTLAATLNHINHTASKHIITLEDPVEYVYTEEKSVVTQRQIGLDTDSFVTGIKYALRQDPDVMLIGEMRDRETIMAAIHAAETGHMVFSTLHTTDAVQTINRIINIFEPHEREPVRLQLANILMGAVSQRLVPRAEGRGRIAVYEIMVVTPTVRDYIVKNQTDAIYQLIAQGDYEGMCSLNASLYRVFRNQQITMETAMQFSDNTNELQQMMRGAYHGAGGR